MAVKETEEIKLEEFILESQPSLEAIGQSLNAFNIFNVLGVQKQETQHSNFLGWLFDPNESHDFGDVFLNGLLKLIRGTGELSVEVFLQLLLADLSDTKVYRETKHDMDIFIVNEALNFTICIENKIHASFSKDQLSKYYNYVETNYGDLEHRIYLTLTPFLDHRHLGYTDGEQYYNITYGAILDLFKAQESIINTAPITIKESIQQYISMLEKDLLGMGKDVELAHEIYKKHHKEIDFIIKNKPSFKNLFGEVKKKYFEESRREDYLLVTPKKYESILRIMPKNAVMERLFLNPAFKSWGNTDYLFCIELMRWSEVIVIKFCFGAINETDADGKLQAIKTQLIKTMKGFASIQKYKRDIVTTSKYPGIIEHKLVYSLDVIKSGKSQYETFVEKFEAFEKEIIKPWIKECKAKENSLMPS
ncbi:MAG: PD-(D/E)XK nuclease family protein [Aureispira sp.]